MKRIMILLSVMMVLCVFAGCAEKADESGAAATVGGDQAVVQGLAADNTEAQPVETATPIPRATPGQDEPVAYTGEQLEIKYYDAGQDKTVTEYYDVAEGEGSQAALNAVNDLFLKGAFGEIGVNEIIHTDGNIFIDFDDSIYNLSAGSASEYPALEAIADAYLNNVEGIKGVYFTVNGSGYSSMNLEFDADEPFKMKQ